MFLNGKIKKKVPFLVLTFTFTFAKLAHSSVGSTQKSTGNYFHAFYSMVKIYSFKAAKPKKKEDAEQGKKTTMRKHYITSCSEREIQ